MHLIKHEFVAAKLDMSKAYDRVEGDFFLEAIMLKLGFEGCWVALIMQCVRTATFLLLINGRSNGFISPQRGLGQGVPLSPYLFLLCADGLSFALMKAVQD